MSWTESGPKLLVFAGPNGSGKSTITQGIPQVGLYVNADDLKAMEGCSSLEAAQKAEAIREHLLKTRRDLTFETVLSTPRNLDLLRRAKEAGYQISAVYVLTRSSDINVQRVRARAAAGGHDVPLDKIKSRCHRSLANLPQLARLADQLRVVDNSDDAPKLLCTVTHRTAEIFPNEHWTKERILLLLNEP